MSFALELEGVTVRYGALTANRDATLRVRRGTVHALVGENGAGKSTLLKAAYGEARAEAGRLVVGGVDLPTARHTPAVAIAHGLGMVHQHFMLAPPLTVAENVVLGREPVRRVNGFGVLDLAEAGAQIVALAGRLGLAVDPTRRVETLSVGEQQRVEIVKVLWRGADVLLLDEPTAVLTPPEVKELFAVLRRLAADGKTIVLVTHKLDEVAALADAVTVMRRGAVVAEFLRGAAPADIARAMVGHDPAPPPAWNPGVTGKPVIEARGLRVGGGGGPLAIDGLELYVGAGEIIGIAGVEGNGQSALCEALAGLCPVAGGVVMIGGHDVTRATPAARADAGLGHIPEDRLHRGLVPAMTVAENLILGRQRELSRGGVLDRAAIAAHARELCARFDVRPPDPRALAGSLSGGNQQKLVLARELTRPGLRALIAAQPTRGVDLGAAAAIHAELLAARDRKVGILLVSSDLTELRALCDVIAVMFRGKLVATLRREDATEDRLGALMTGAASAEVAA